MVILEEQLYLLQFPYHEWMPPWTFAPRLFHGEEMSYGFYGVSFACRGHYTFLMGYWVTVSGWGVGI